MGCLVERKGEAEPLEMGPGDYINIPAHKRHRFEWTFEDEPTVWLACLTAGTFLLLIIGDRVSPNIALLTKAIQGAPGLGFTLGLAEMRLYEMNAGSDWPLIVVPEVVGKTVEKTRGVVQVRYIQEKPQVEVEVEDEDGKGPSPNGKIDLESFLRQIPKDLVKPYREGIEQWETLGGNIHFTSKMIFFRTEIGGEQRHIVRCRQNQVSVIQRKSIEQWSNDLSLHDNYLSSLESSPVVAQHVRDDCLWIKYDKLSGNDLRVLLRAARELVQQIKVKE